MEEESDLEDEAAAEDEREDAIDVDVVEPDVVEVTESEEDVSAELIFDSDRGRRE